MSDHSIPWTASLTSANGVFVTEFDCVVECTVKRTCEGDPYLHSIDAILVSNGHALDWKACDLLSRESGPVLYMIGIAEAERLLRDKDFADRAIELHEADREGSYADFKRELTGAE